MELMLDSDTITQEWIAHRARRQITVKSGGGASAYDQMCWEWIKKAHPGKLQSWNQYLHIKSVIATLKKNNAWEAFQDFCAVR
eukprot:14474081-Alexandrium_andersonii.AAC.1